MKLNDKNNYRNPPDYENFYDLFHFIWNHGVGNKVSDLNDPIPWTDSSLEHAFETVKKPVDRRTIQNWLSGKNLPNRRNMHALAKIVSGGEEYRRKKWADALISTLKETPRDRVTKTSAVNEPSIETKSKKEKYSKTKFVFLSLALVASLVLAAFYLYPSNQKSAKYLLAVQEFRVLNVNLQNEDTNTANLISIGMATDLSTSMANSGSMLVAPLRSNQNLSSKTSISEVCKQLEADNYLEGTIQTEGQKTRINANLIQCKDEISIWSKSFDTNSTSLLEIQKTIAEEIRIALDILLTPEEKKRMFSFGTENPYAYESYLRGRGLIKKWHGIEKNKDDIWLSLMAFEETVQEDPEMSRAWIHMQDIYYHFGVGDIDLPKIPISAKLPQSKMDSVKHSLRVLHQGQKTAKTKSDELQSKLNYTFFSDDWSTLRDEAIQFSKEAIKEPGELEWLFGPVALTFLGEEKHLNDLVYKRILRYDPDYGTGHAYAVRQLLLNSKYSKANELLDKIFEPPVSSTLLVTSSRLDETKGYLYFAMGDVQKLSSLINDRSNKLSDGQREYFDILTLLLNGDMQEAKAAIENATNFENSSIYSAMASVHAGDLIAAKKKLNSIVEEPMGIPALVVQLAYGIGCGPNQIPTIPQLDKRLRDANIELPSCIGQAR